MGTLTYVNLYNIKQSILMRVLYSTQLGLNPEPKSDHTMRFAVSLLVHQSLKEFNVFRRWA